MSRLSRPPWRTRKNDAGRGIPAVSQPPRAWLRVAIPLVIFAVVFIAFAPALSADFVNWDDDKNITRNESFRGLSPRHLRWMFTTFHMGPYQPLAWLTLGIDYSLGGLRPFVYHLTNVVLHALAAVAFYTLARRLFCIAHEEIMDAPPVDVCVTALWAALLFALHPLRCESVAWVTERRDVLCGVFFPLTILAYLRFTAAAHGPLRRRWPLTRRERFAFNGGVAARRVKGWYLAALFLLLLCLLSKASGMVLPAALLLLDIWPLRRFRENIRRSLVEKIPFAAMAGTFAALALHGQAHAAALSSFEQLSLSQRLAQSMYGLAFYPYKTLLPFNLVPVYELPEPFVVLAPRFIIAGVAVAAITIALVLLRRRWPAGLTAWAAFIVIVAPVVGLTQAGPQLVADRYSYLSCMPFALLAGGALLALVRNRAALQSTAWSIAALTIAALAALTWRQASIWRDSESLWTHALRVNPDSWNACQNLGQVRARQGGLTDDPTIKRDKAAEAIALFDKGYCLHPDPAFLFNLTLSFAATAHEDPAAHPQETQLALEYAQRARKAFDERGREMPRFNMEYGVLMAKLRRFDEALPILEAVAVENPEVREVRLNLGSVLAELNRPAEAIPHFEAAVRLDIDNCYARLALAVTYARTGRRADARQALEAVLKMKSDRLGLNASSDPEYRQAQQLLTSLH